jgi:hypothetical protein
VITKLRSKGESRVEKQEVVGKIPRIERVILQSRINPNWYLRNEPKRPLLKQMRRGCA